MPPFTLIIALDFDDESMAWALIDQLDPGLAALKVGSQMFTLFGPTFVRTLVSRGFKVFLDLKFYDIPNTVARACAAGAELGVWMLNVHASGGLAMLQAARQALVPYGSKRPLLVAVTVLTSQGSSDDPSSQSLEQRVLELAMLTQEANLDGVVSSAREVSLIKASCGQDFLTVTPGIRLPTDKNYDQNRVVTPEDAIHAGSDYLVIGRPITCAKNSMTVIRDVLSRITMARLQKTM